MVRPSTFLESMATGVGAVWKLAFSASLTMAALQREGLSARDRISLILRAHHDSPKN
jgi:hypothetical protein